MKNIGTDNFLQKLFLCLCIFFSGCGVSRVDINPYPKDPTGIKKIETDKRFSIRNINDKREMNSSLIGSVNTGFSNKPTSLYSKRSATKLVKNIFENVLELTDVKAESLKTPDYFIDIDINKLEFYETMGLTAEYGHADAEIEITFVISKNNKSLASVQIVEDKKTKGIDVSGRAEGLLSSVLETVGKKFKKEVKKIAILSPDEIKDLSVKEENKVVSTDTTFLSSASNLKVKILNIIEGVPDSIAVVSWDIRPGPRGVAKMLYKLGSMVNPPLDDWDTTGSMKNTSPDTICINEEGKHIFYLWLVDNAGKTNYQNAISVPITYYKPFKPKQIVKSTALFGIDVTSFPIPSSFGNDKSFSVPGDEKYLGGAFIGYGLNLGVQHSLTPYWTMGLTGDGKTLGMLAEESDWEYPKYDTGQEKCKGVALYFIDAGINLNAQIFTSNYLWSITPTFGWRYFAEHGELKFTDTVSMENRSVTKDKIETGISFGGELARYISIKSATPFTVLVGYHFYPFFDNLSKINAGFTFNTRNKSGWRGISKSSIGPFFELYRNKDIVCISVLLKADIYF
ncbi:MAG: hypothetical protein PHX21_05005 [bacterium]|nr:hypothetical protein [bacterium]